jgi:predicted DNA repair protein MutK
MSGLLALLDDVVALTKLTAATLDDAASQAVKASAKAAGVVIDDAAVTPRYVTATSCCSCFPPHCCSAPSCPRRSRHY